MSNGRGRRVLFKHWLASLASGVIGSLQGANVYDSHPSSLHGPHYLHPQPKEHFSRMDLCPHSMASLECQLYQSMEFCRFCYYVSSLPWTGLDREWLNENSIVNFMHLTKVFCFCGDIVCFGGKDLDFKTNQSWLESGLHHLLLSDLGQIIQSFWVHYKRFVVEIFWDDFLMPLPIFW